MEDPQAAAWSRCCGGQRLCHGGTVCAASAALGVDAVPAHGQRLSGSLRMKQLFLAAACSWRNRRICSCSDSASRIALPRSPPMLLALLAVLMVTKSSYGTSLASLSSAQA